MNRNKSLIITSSLALLLTGCATTETSENTSKPNDQTATTTVEPKKTVIAEKKIVEDKSSATWTTNPKPAQKLSNYGKFELRPLTMNEKFSKDAGNNKAKGLVETEINSQIAPQLQQWNKDTGNTLIIEPNIQEIRFISGTARFWGGALAGNSRILLSAKLIDSQTGEVIANPVFYQRANAYAAAWSAGSHDRSMLTRVVTLMNKYLINNYPEAIGGETGRR